MMANTMYKELCAQMQSQVKQIIHGFNIPEEIRQIARKRVDEYIPNILGRNVPKLLEGQIEARIVWYKESIESLQQELEKLQEDLKTERSKRRKVHRAHLALLAQFKSLEARIVSLEQKPVVEEKTPCKRSWKWK